MSLKNVLPELLKYYLSWAWFLLAVYEIVLLLDEAPKFYFVISVNFAKHSSAAQYSKYTLSQRGGFCS